MKKKALLNSKRNYFAPRDNGRKFQDEVPTKEGNLTFPSREGGYGVSRKRMSFIGASILSFTLILLSLFTLNYSSIFNLSSPTVHAADASADTDTVDSTSSAQLSIAVPTSIALSITSTSGDSTCDDASTNTLCLKWSDDGKKATGSQAILVQTNNPTGYTVTVDNGDGMLHPLGSSNASTNTTTIPFTYSAQEADKGKVKTTTMNSTANQITYDWTATPNKPNYLTKMDSYSQKVVYYATANDAGANIVYPSTRRIYNFAYTGAVQTFTAPYDGKYKVEAWGASSGIEMRDGALAGEVYMGNGGYATGMVQLNRDDKLYLAVGAQGENGDGSDTPKTYHPAGGWNGGGNGLYDYSVGISEDDNGKHESTAGGGGATSIAFNLIDDGQLRNYENSRNDVLVVAGGGGSVVEYNGGIAYGSSGGGYRGGNGISTNTSGLKAPAGTQSGGYAFGVGESATFNIAGNEYGAGGGGWYGGYAGTGTTKGTYLGGGGGSGYIGNDKLSDKHMAIWKVTGVDEADIRTITTDCRSETPTVDCAKIGSGYVRITYLGK